MSFLVQKDVSTMPKQGLGWFDLASNARLISKLPAQEKARPLMSAMPRRRADNFDIPSSESLYFQERPEDLLTPYLLQPITNTQLFARFSVLLQDRGTAFVESAGLIPAGENAELADALADLRASPDEAREEGLPVPSSRALQNGELVLRKMYGIWPRRFEVYSMPKGEIAIDAPSGKGCSVIVLCDSQGGALCSVNLKGSHRRAHYSDAQILPDSFLRDAIRDMRANVRE